MYATFNRFEIEMSQEQAESGSHQGECYEDVKALLSEPEIAAQFETIKADDIREELKEYGAWDDQELSDDEENRIRIMWIACGDISTEGKSSGYPVD